MFKTKIGMLAMMSLCLSSDSAEGTVVETPAKPLANGDNVEWTNEEGEECFGKIQNIENGIALVQDDDGVQKRVPLDDLTLAGEFKVVAELPVDASNPESKKIAFTLKKYKKARKGNEAFLESYAFAVPRFPDVETLRTHLDNLLKKQNRHASQNPESGVTADDIILDNIHGMLDGKLRTKVKNEATAEVIKIGGKDIVTQPAINEWLGKHTEKVLFNPDQAFNYLPGIREASGISKIKALSQKIKELAASGVLPTDPQFQAVLMELAQAAL